MYTDRSASDKIFEKAHGCRRSLWSYAEPAGSGFPDRQQSSGSANEGGLVDLHLDPLALGVEFANERAVVAIAARIPLGASPERASGQICSGAVKGAVYGEESRSHSLRACAELPPRRILVGVA